MQVRIDREILLKLSDPNKERNIYTHPLWLARDIFWQRLEYAFKYLERYANKDMTVLDFGGGSGVFSKALSSFFENISVIDLDVEEAVNIISYFDIKNVSLINQDINQFETENKYDLIIATDVLEHFKELQYPIDFFNKFLKDDGMLLVTLPTENWVYELGRKIVNKEKPVDHYHSSKEVIDCLKQNNFTEIDKMFVPRYIIPIPLFEVALFRFKQTSLNG